MPNLTIDIKDSSNKVKGKVTLSEEVFNSGASEAVVHSVVKGYLANQRQGTHATKTRGMVSGGGKKPWKQKHTGRARHGSTRSPLWRGGGITFGPQPRDYSVKLPKAMRRAALYKALTMKLADGEIIAVDALSFDKPRTKEMVKLIANLGLEGKSVLVILPEVNENVILSSRNIPGVDVVRVSDLNAYHVALYDTAVITADALTQLQGNAEASTK